MYTLFVWFESSTAAVTDTVQTNRPHQHCNRHYVVPVDLFWGCGDIACPAQIQAGGSHWYCKSLYCADWLRLAHQSHINNFFVHCLIILSSIPYVEESVLIKIKRISFVMFFKKNRMFFLQCLLINNVCTLVLIYLCSSICREKQASRGFT